MALTPSPSSSGRSGRPLLLPDLVPINTEPSQLAIFFIRQLRHKKDILTQVLKSAFTLTTAFEHPFEDLISVVFNEGARAKLDNLGYNTIRANAALKSMVHVIQDALNELDKLSNVYKDTVAALDSLDEIDINKRALGRIRIVDGAQRANKVQLRALREQTAAHYPTARDDSVSFAAAYYANVVLKPQEEQPLVKAAAAPTLASQKPVLEVVNEGKSTPKPILGFQSNEQHVNTQGPADEPMTLDELTESDLIEEAQPLKRQPASVNLAAQLESHKTAAFIQAAQRIDDIVKRAVPNNPFAAPAPRLAVPEPKPQVQVPVSTSMISERTKALFAKKDTVVTQRALDRDVADRFREHLYKNKNIAAAFPSPQEPSYPAARPTSSVLPRYQAAVEQMRALCAPSGTAPVRPAEAHKDLNSQEPKETKVASDGYLTKQMAKPIKTSEHGAASATEPKATLISNAHVSRRPYTSSRLGAATAVAPSKLPIPVPAPAPVTTAQPTKRTVVKEKKELTFTPPTTYPAYKPALAVRDGLAVQLHVGTPVHPNDLIAAHGALFRAAAAKASVAAAAKEKAAGKGKGKAVASCLHIPSQRTTAYVRQQRR